MDTIVMPNICKIMNFYSIVSSVCGGEDVKITFDNVPVEQGKTSTNVLKIILIVLCVLV
jgi:hypothetical protein